MLKWKSIRCSPTVLDIGIVLNCGQSFRWKLLDGYWIGVYRRKVWKLKQENNLLWYTVLNNAQKNTRKRTSDVICRKKSKTDVNIVKVVTGHEQECSDEEDILRDYFQLDVDLPRLCNNWSKLDPHFAEIHVRFPGVRMLRQDPIENLFSFICSSNNNITRISSMIEKMCQSFGQKLVEVDGTNYYSFPDIESLANDGTEGVLRGLGFGYRAKYIHQSAVKIIERGGSEWLCNLRTMPYADAHKNLTALPGIGAKVADCICMMSLDKYEAIPVDTHVWQIAVRDYNIKTLKDTKTLTTSSYKSIGDHFRNLWGPYASWAMNFLFVADLKQFQNRK